MGEPSARGCSKKVAVSIQSNLILSQHPSQTPSPPIMESCDSTTSQPATTRLLYQLCDACRANFPPDREWSFPQHFQRGGRIATKYTLRHCTLKDIRVAATAGCHVCVKILDGLLGYAIDMDAPIRLYLYGSNLSTRLSFVISSRDGSGRPLDIFTWVYLQRPGRTETPATSDVQSISLPDSNMSLFALKKAKELLHLCRLTHSECRLGRSVILESQQSKFIRLINIQSQDTHNYTCRLVNHSLRDDVDYVTLSYRWSAEVGKTRLTQNNKDIYYDSIPTST